ncbi:MAG: NACHT domain-containing protein, partial [Myxococcota bacterium]
MSRTSLQTVGLEGTLTPRDLTRRLARAMTLRPYRAAIALIEVQGDALAQARAAVEAAGAETERAATPDELLIEVMEGSEADKVTLTRLNRERDPLLKAYRAVVLLVVGPKAMRWVHGVAPDLISAPDLSGILLAGATHHKPANPWGDVRRSVCEFMRTKHASLDMTGLLPSLSERRHIELDAIYLPLVELRKSHLKPAGWLVLGNPGAGKTTLLRHLALEMARGKDPLGIGEALPLLVSLADYSVFRQQERVVSLVAFLPRWFSAHSIEGGEQIADHLCEVCLLLDGLDEVHDAGVRRSILAEASGLLAHDKVAGVVITGRSFVVDEVRRQEHETLQTRKVHPPTDGEIERFLHSFARLTGREEHEAERLSQR